MDVMFGGFQGQYTYYGEKKNHFRESNTDSLVVQPEAQGH
jgi:hypothetical protein